MFLAASNCINQSVARLNISGDKRRDFPVAKKRFVSSEAKV